MTLRSSLPAQPNNSLILGITCFQQVIVAGRPVGSRELSRHLGLTHTRVNRLLGTLAHLGLVDRTANHKYRAGPALHVLVAQSMMGSGLLPCALPPLMRLRQEGFTVALGVLWREQVCYLLHERPWQEIEDSLGHYPLVPAQFSSIGLALLAAEPGEIVISKLPLPDVGPFLPADYDPAAAIEAARKDGYALLRFTEGEMSIGVTVGQPPIAAIAVSGRHIGNEHINAIVKKLHAASAEISTRLDQRPPPAITHPFLQK